MIAGNPAWTTACATDGHRAHPEVASRAICSSLNGIAMRIGCRADDEAVQDLEAQRDDGKEIACPGLMEVVANKRGPALATVARQVWWSVLGDGPRRDAVTKLSKFCGDSVLSLKRVLIPKPPNQAAQVGIGVRSANGPLGRPPPDQTPKGTMPVTKNTM